MDGFCWGKSHIEMDDDWWYPHDYGNPHMLHGAGISINIYPQNHPSVCKHTIHGTSGLWSKIAMEIIVFNNYVYVDIEVSYNRGTPKSSILNRLSIYNSSIFGYPYWIGNRINSEYIFCEISSDSVLSSNCMDHVRELCWFTILFYWRVKLKSWEIFTEHLGQIAWVPTKISNEPAERRIFYFSIPSGAERWFLLENCSTWDFLYLFLSQQNLWG